MRRAATVLLLAMLPLCSLAGERIDWLIYDTPPQIIKDGEGFGQAQFRVLTAHLPEFTHRLQPVALQRLWHDMSSRDGICTLDVVRTPERAAVYAYSARSMLLPGFRLLVRYDHLQEVRAAVNGKGEVDLERLRNQSQLRGGFVSGRRHPQFVDRFIEESGNLTGYAEAVQLFSMLQAGRIDYAVVLAAEVPYYSLNQTAAMLAIAGEPLNLRSYVACSGSVIGPKVIGRIDRVLSDDAVWKQFVAPLKRWLSPEDFAMALESKPE
jgi:uncharacterized protein (TIGR02285 family)